MQTDLYKIKKHYGENMMHLCKTLFPTILEVDGLLFEIISSKFAYSKTLYDDIKKQNKINEFQNYIIGFSEKKKNIYESNLDPFYLMDKAGYTLYECRNEDDVQKFRKYYRYEETLCTFNTNRTDDHHVFFAVKKNANDIRREDFKVPDRQDEYGTSVISIQFTKGKYNNLSIKNRYNHSVMKSDATFSNNLDNIIPGLTDSFRKKYGFNIYFTDLDFELDHYIYAKDGKHYNYNYFIGDAYYCSNNIIIDIDKINRYDKEKYIIADYFIIDLVNKRISLYDYTCEDSFVDLPPIKKITVTNTNEGKLIQILMNNNFMDIIVNKKNQIISYHSNLTELGDNYLYYNKTLNSFSDDNLKEIGDNFLPINNTLKEINLPNLEKVGDYFLTQNVPLKEFDFPKLREVGSAFLRACSKEVVYLPNLERVGSSFLASDHELRELILPKLIKTGPFFLNFNVHLKKISLPMVEEIEHHFLTRNKGLDTISFPNLKKVGDYFLFDNRNINSVNLPKVRIIGNEFLQHNYRLINLNIPNVLEIGYNFLGKNRLLETLSLLNVIKINDDFLLDNDHLISLYLPNLQVVGNNFLPSNNSLKEIDISNLRLYGDNFLSILKNTDINVQKQLVKTLKN